jgi:hypothetical protein
MLEEAPIGGWGELARWLRGEVLAGAWESAGDVAVVRFPHALEVVTDGVMATYAGATDRALAGPIDQPWRSWSHRHPPATATDPAVAELVRLVAAATPESLDAAASALQAARADGWSWPLAMHDASWAIELTSRSRSTVVAQLEAVRALLGVTGPRPRPDIVAAVVAAVHATAAADLLPTATVDAMRTPLLSQLPSRLP